MTDDFGGFFDDQLKGGGGAPGFNFATIGNGVKGVVTDIFKTVVYKMDGTTKKLDKNGKEIPQLNVTLQTDLRDWKGVKNVPTDEDGNAKPASEDDGTRRLFVKYQLGRAIAEAIQASGSKSSDFKKGATLAVKYVSDQPMKEGAMKIFEARFEKGEETADDFFTETSEAAPAKEAPAAAPAQDDEPPF